MAKNREYLQRKMRRRNVRKREQMRPMTRDIVAIDGEGENTGNVWSIKLPTEKMAWVGGGVKSNRVAHAHQHKYTLLAASTGDYIRTDGPDGLSTAACLAFLLSLSRRDRLIVGFAINYDINMMLKDLPPEKLRQLDVEGRCRWGDYSIQWIPSKSLSIQSGWHQDGDSWKSSQSVTIWDVFGYFQMSFVRALQAWQIGDPEVVERIQAMKEKRGHFDEEDKDSVLGYCQEECRLLVELVRRLLDCTEHVGIFPTRYDGAGSLASAILDKYHTTDYLKTHDDAEELGLYAYYGGRFESLQVGLWPEGWVYDINSAYPHALTKLPCLTHARWRQARKIPTHGLALVYLSWHLPKDTVIGPFSYRHEDGSICYPSQGRGWYWGFEILNAIPILETGNWETHRIHELVVGCEEQPFEHIPVLYEERRLLKEKGDLGHQPLKLGYNSEYGKLAQGVGWKGRRPKFRTWVGASFVTAHCRMQILKACMQNPSSIVSIITDGIISTERLDLPVSGALGEWDERHIEDLFVLHPGLYRYREEDKWTKKASGLNVNEFDWDEAEALWRRYGPLMRMEFRMTRFMGLGVALQRNKLEKGWRCWVDEPHEISATQMSRWLPKYSSYALYLPDQYENMRTVALRRFEDSQPFRPKQTWAGAFERNHLDLMMELDQP